MTKPAEAGVRTGDNVSSEAHTMEELLEIQRAAFLRDGIPDAKTRIDRINRLQALLLDNSDEIREALDADFGTRPRELSVAADVAGCMIDLTHQRRSLEKWMKETNVAKVQGLLGYKQRLRHDPLRGRRDHGPVELPAAADDRARWLRHSPRATASDAPVVDHREDHRRHRQARAGLLLHRRTCSHHLQARRRIGLRRLKVDHVLHRFT